MLDNLLYEMDEEKSSNIVIYSSDMGGLNSFILDLKSEGYEVYIESCKHCMENIQKCIIETLNEKCPSVVIIDNDFDNTGISFFKMIKNEGTIENIPVIFLGFKDINTKLEILRLGAIDYLEKPYNITELSNKTKNLMDIGKKFINSRIFDTLTRVYSRKYGEAYSKKVFKASNLEKIPYTVLALDIDNMSMINKVFGKERGNLFLKEFSSILKQNLDMREFIYRYSGEKFIFVLPGKNTVEALRFSEKMQYEVAKLSDQYNIKISFTAGIASYNGITEDEKKIVNYALQSLNEGKKDGKSRTYIHLSSIEDDAKKSILILDEDEILLSILKTRYIHKGYEVFTTNNYDNAMNVICEKNIDLIITDFSIPGIGCAELIKSSQNINKSLKIIVLSSQRNENCIEIALNAGADDYITKPFSPVELDLRIHKLFR